MTATTDEQADAVIAVLSRAADWPTRSRNGLVLDEGHEHWAAANLAKKTGLMWMHDERKDLPGFLFTVTPLGYQFLEKWAAK